MRFKDVLRFCGLLTTAKVLNMEKTYFLAPTRNTTPAGPIFLGSIIKSPRSPELSLNGKSSPLLKELEIFEDPALDSTVQMFKTGEGKAGIWAQFLDGVGIGGEISGSRESVDTATYKFDELLTKTIAPDLPWVKKMFKVEEIQDSIKSSRFRANLYMITGIKIAKGAEIAMSKIAAKGGKLQFGIDTTPAGVPLKFGPDISSSSTAGQIMSEKHPKEFIFAYRLREITYTRKKAEDQKEVSKGDLYGAGEKKSREKEEEDFSKDEAVFDMYSSQDVDGEIWELETKEAVDVDGKKVAVVGFDEDEDD